jgi:Cft2 family RNA processing exonuclease
VARVTGAGVRVLVPAFAAGRAQEIALLCAQRLPGAPVIIDGLAREVSRLYEGHDDPDGKPLEIFTTQVRPVAPGTTATEIAAFGTGVIIASSGMLAGGPALTWARHLLPDPRAAVAIVGYCDQNTAARRLLDLAQTGGRLLELPGGNGSPPVPVAAAVSSHQLGAHASADELVTIAAAIKARHVMLVHGQPPGQRKLRHRLQLRSQQTVDTLTWPP